MIPNGYKQTEIGVVPLDWEVVNLQDMSKITMGQSPKSNTYNTNGVGVPLIQGNADCKNRRTVPRTHTTELTKECFVGDIIMTVRAPVGAISKSLHNACIGRGVCAIKANEDNDFLYHFFVNYEDKWDKLSQGSTFTAVSGNDIKTIQIPLPPLTQQKKIAKILSTTDNKIEAITKQIEKAEMVKKGLMQRLLNDNFKIEKLKKCTILIKDGTHGTHKDVTNGVPLLSAKDIKNGKISWDEKSRKISLNDFNKIHKNYSLCNGDLLLTVVGTLGRVALIKEYSNNYTFQRSVAIIRLLSDCSPKYFYYVFESNYFQKQLILHSNASAQAGVYLGELEKLKIPLPPLKQQQKIANILSKSDQKIEILKSKKEQYQTLKTGLMQKLLTGEIRV